MASEDEVLQTLLDAIDTEAKKAAAEPSATSSEKYASATRQLAEAYAWMNSPTQPHGGQGSVA